VLLIAILFATVYWPDSLDPSERIMLKSSELQTF
jgi:hypothetical protein